jgi:hypothetical protein
MNDKQKCTPDLATVARESSKERLDEKLQKALDNPKLDRAIARVKPKLKPGEDPLFYDVNTRLSSPSLTGVTPVDSAVMQTPIDPAPNPGDQREAGDERADGEDEPTAPGSPWVQRGAGPELDKAALPSAHVPPAAPPTSVPIAAPRSGRRLPPWLLGGLSPRLLAIGAVFAVLAPVTIVLLLSKSVRPNEGPHGDARSGAAASMTPVPTVVTPTAAPRSTNAAPTAAPAPSAVVDAGALPVQPAPSSAPPPGPRAPAHPPRPAPTDDPYSPTPTPPATVAPAPPPTVAPITPPTSTSAKPSPDLY